MRKMTVKAQVISTTIKNVKTFKVVKNNFEDGTPYLTIRINHRGDLCSDQDITLWPVEDDNFKDMDLENIPDQYKD